MIVLCKQCSSPFDLSPKDRRNRVKNNNSDNFFCSHDCSSRYQSQSLRREVAEKVRKDCSRCGLPFSEEEAVYRGKHAVRGYCRKCLYTYQYKRWNRRKVAAIEYLGGRCKKCGRTGHPVIFDFHHRLAEDKEFDWSKLRIKSWDKVLAELDKCDLLCSPCHRIHHVNPEMWDFLETTQPDLNK